jgi:hypothetical protein
MRYPGRYATCSTEVDDETEFLGLISQVFYDP